jgi:hypothetical protein
LAGVLLGVSLVVVIDHRPLLAALHGSGLAFLVACDDLRTQAEASIRDGGPVKGEWAVAGSETVRR